MPAYKQNVFDKYYIIYDIATLQIEWSSSKYTIC